jgi:hypothetical protein
MNQDQTPAKKKRKPLAWTMTKRQFKHTQKEFLHGRSARAAKPRTLSIAFWWGRASCRDSAFSVDPPKLPSCDRRLYAAPATLFRVAWKAPHDQDYVLVNHRRGSFCLRPSESIKALTCRWAFDVLGDVDARIKINILVCSFPRRARSLVGELNLASRGDRSRVPAEPKGAVRPSA